ncbi:MAG TPA: peptidylprolyl isomerase [Mycobacteriales bacterium]|nr:peptidylprolyl isomerase [Mycobacteriales bacterium]
MKRTAVLVAGLLVAAMLSACGSGIASGSGAGVAARVGNEIVTVPELTEVVTRSLKDSAIAAQAASDRAAFQRNVLGRLILAELYEEAARDLDITVTDEEVTESIAQIEQRLGGRPQLLQAAAGMGLVEADIPDFVRSGLVNEAVGTKLVADRVVTDADLKAAYDANRGRFESAEVQHILVATEVRARGVLARLRAGEDFATLAKTFSIDPGSKDRGGNLGTNPRGTFFVPFENAVFAAKIGELVGPVQTEAGFHVIKVLARETRTLEQAKEELTAEVRNSGLEESRATYLSALSARLRIRINPRFGRWDAATATVLADGNELSSPEPQPGGPADGGLVPPIGGDPNQPPPGDPNAPPPPGDPNAPPPGDPNAPPPPQG